LPRFASQLSWHSGQTVHQNYNGFVIFFGEHFTEMNAMKFYKPLVGNLLLESILPLIFFYPQQFIEFACVLRTQEEDSKVGM